MKKLTLKNYYFWGFIGPSGEEILSLQHWLSKLSLHGKESRSRTRFLLLLTDRIKEIEIEREKMIKENAEKNKEGKIIYLNEKGKETTEPQAQIKLKKENKLNEEFGDYLQEDLVLDVSPANADTIHLVRDIILNTTQEFKDIMAVRYAKWCNSFEDIKEDKK